MRAASGSHRSTEWSAPLTGWYSCTNASWTAGGINKWHESKLHESWSLVSWPAARRCLRPRAGDHQEPHPIHRDLFHDAARWSGATVGHAVRGVTLHGDMAAVLTYHLSHVSL